LLLKVLVDRASASAPARIPELIEVHPTQQLSLSPSEQQDIDCREAFTLLRVEPCAKDQPAMLFAAVLKLTNAKFVFSAELAEVVA